MKYKILLAACLVVVVIPSAGWAYALSPHDAGYQHGASDEKKMIQGRKDLYILQPGNGWADHTGQFIQGYVEGVNSTKGMPKDWQVGYQYGDMEWTIYGPGSTLNNSTKPHPFECPFKDASNFCLGYDAALAYQNSDN